jgi:hypothetical protein
MYSFAQTGIGFVLKSTSATARTTNAAAIEGGQP